MNDGPISPAGLQPLIARTIFAEHIFPFEEIGSTNTAAMQAAAQGAEEGSVFLAERQTHGRGRGDNVWHSAPGSILCSVILRPELPAQEILVLSLMTGLAVSLAIEEICGFRVDLRWPNDVLIGERKLGGILTELSVDHGKVRYAVIGFGLNVNQDLFPGDLRELAVSLRMETGKEWPQVEILGAILRNLDGEYKRLRRSQKDAVTDCLARFENRSSYVRGKRVSVPENGGYSGITDGLDANGFLRVKTDRGMRKVLSGGVRPL